MKITKKQYEEIEEAREYGREEFHGMLEEYTGIVAKPYTAFDYYDSCGNYLGDSVDYTTRDLLKSAYIEIEGG
jgi:hypothetical protein